MNEFKLNFYFSKYKDFPLPNSDYFKKNFLKNEGNFIYLNELVIMIIKYQVKKYGQTLPNPFKISKGA